jgi:hypothetical protein
MMPPSPLELMALADGELEEPRKGEVERWLAEQPGRQAQQRQREGFHRLVGEAARAREAAQAAPDLSGNILALLEQETAPTQSGPRARPGAVVVPLRRWPSSRKLLGALAFGTAAAAALALWWRPTTQPTPGKPVLVASSRMPSPDVIEEDAVVGDDSTAITSVDFGTQSGAIFYVRGQTTASAVLWIDDTPSPLSTP